MYTPDVWDIHEYTRIHHIKICVDAGNNGNKEEQKHLHPDTKTFLRANKVAGHCTANF